MLKWLSDAIIYEIYPISFYDSNGDGLGDLNGITQKIPYLADLGINVVWINPFYKSPFRDGGYDVTDYYDVDKRFGTLLDFERMVKAFHDANIKVIVDLVVGHTSDKHPWFIKSKKANPDVKYKDWYIWTDSCFTPANKSISGMSKRNGNYLINYYAFQPALNYGFNEIKKGEEKWQWHYTDSRLTPLREEVLRIIKFWLDKGVDGFRVDLANSLVKADVDSKGVKWFWNIVINSAKQINPDCCFLSEWGDPIKAIECGFDLDYLCHSTQCYNELFRSESGTNLTAWLERAEHSYFCKDGKGSFNGFLQLANKIFQNKNSAYTIPTGYHDIIRIAQKKEIGVIKCIFAFILTFKCVPQIYYGDEIGIKHNFSVNKDGGYLRTGARTPMQWNNSTHRGFTTAKRGYLPTEKAKERSVESQRNRVDSLYNTVKRLIALRKEYSQFSYSSNVEMICDGYPLQYQRTSDDGSVFVAINPTKNEYEVPYINGEILMQNNVECKQKTIKLKEFSFIVIKR